MNLRDISVVVQGPIVGSKASRPDDQLTRRSLVSIREVLPGSTIILSTWKGQDVSGLDFDILAESDDPGYTYTTLDTFEPGNIREDSANRQIVSTRAGLERAVTKYAIKMRSDLILTHSGFIEYFERYADLTADPAYRVLPHRIVTLTTCDPRRRHKFPFTVADWFYFGHTNDLMDIFNIPLLSAEKYRSETIDGRTILHVPYSTEQYIWCSFLSKHVSLPFRHVIDATEENITLSEKYLANNCILLPAKQAGINWLKYPGAAYAQVPALSNTGLYTWNQYQHLLNRYARCSLHITPNPTERLIYAIVYNSRYAIKKISPTLHDLIARTVNPAAHQKLRQPAMSANIKRLVIWGLKKKYHTHRHIHESFFKNAKKLGLGVIWVEDELQSQKYIRPGDLIIAAEVIGKMVPEKTKEDDYFLPVRDDVFYCLHNYKQELFKHKLRDNQYINLQFYSNEFTLSDEAEYWGPVTIFDKKTRTLYQPWGTDLLAREFLPPVFNRNKLVFWIGSIWNDSLNRGNIAAIAALRESLAKHGLRFIRLRFIPDFLNRFFIRRSRIAPAIAGAHQVKVDYLPCRMFKNISYGQLGITNVRKFRELLGDASLPGETIEELVSYALGLTEQEYREKVLAQQKAIARYTYKDALENIERALSVVSDKK